MKSIEYKLKVKCDHRSKFSNFKQLERSLKKIRASTGFQPMTSAIQVLVEHRTGIAEVMGSNPVEALIFFRLLSNCLKLENLLR